MNLYTENIVSTAVHSMYHYMFVFFPVKGQFLAIKPVENAAVFGYDLVPGSWFWAVSGGAIAPDGRGPATALVFLLCLL